jgi:hypothetical protein
MKDIFNKDGQFKMTLLKRKKFEKEIISIVAKEGHQTKKPLGRNIFEFEQFTSTKYLKTMID